MTNNKKHFFLYCSRTMVYLYSNIAMGMRKKTNIFLNFFRPKSSIIASEKLSVILSNKIDTMAVMKATEELRRDPTKTKLDIKLTQSTVDRLLKFAE